MRRLSPHTPPAAAATPPAAPPPELRMAVDPPLVAALVAPLYALRDSLGSGASVPSEAISGALTESAAHIAGTEDPHRAGIAAVESTATGQTVDHAVPAMRRTGTEMAALGDNSAAYLEILNAAHTTSATARAKVDRIIEEFRADARDRLSAPDTAAPDNDAVMDRGALALREALGTVAAARTEMDDHSRRLDALGESTVTTPTGWTPVADRTGTGTGTGTGTSSAPTWSSGWSGGGGMGGMGSGFGGNGFGGGWQQPQTVVVPGGTPGQPPDPAMMAKFAEVQVQTAAISAGVQLGTSALQAGVQLGTGIIDRAAETIMHGVDTGGKLAERAIDTGLPAALGQPGTGTDKNGDGKPDDPGTGDKPGGTAGMFDFGGTGDQGGKPDQGGQDGKPPTGTVIPPGPGDSPGGESGTTGGQASTPPPQKSVIPPDDDAPAPAPHREPAPAPGSGAVLPPPTPPGETERPRRGQLGVTVEPAAAVSGAAVIDTPGTDAADELASLELAGSLDSDE
ncbi:hypothetical protein [Nocardia wallacei]|uniref:hypothetical protein n=1 Tax=Nocardia wallacei TaxID=480035 RepID=UPI002456BB15|nr:hypothetical protein [Nocardia wallacei]